MADTSPCSLDDAALQQRAHVWESLRGAWLGSERTATGAVMQYRLDPAVAQTLVELVEAEKRCCPSVSFEATVTLRIEAPEAMRPWVVSTFVSTAGDTTTGAGRDRVSETQTPAGAAVAFTTKSTTSSS